LFLLEINKYWTFIIHIKGDIIDISEEGKVRLMVIAIVAMLAITMVVAGWQYEEQVEIDIQEGSAEINIEYLEEKGEVEDVSKSAVATTEVEENSELELNVFVGTMVTLGVEEQTEIVVSMDATGEFEEELTPDSFRFSGRILYDGEDEVAEVPLLHFETGYTDIDNGSVWAGRRHKLSTRGLEAVEPAFIGFDLDDNSFDAESRMLWYIPFDNEVPHTLELKAIVEGMSEEVTSTVQVNISEPEGGDEG